MNRILRLLTIYIFINYCSNALAQTENESGEEAENAAEAMNSVENDGVEDNRGDDDNRNDDYNREVEDNRDDDDNREVEDNRDDDDNRQVEDNRDDYTNRDDDNNNEDVDGINVKHTNLMALDYYNGKMGSPENYESPPQYQLLKSSTSGTARGSKKNIVVLDNMDVRNYRAELKAGNKADVLGSNQHYYQPDVYPDFSRRFVLQYPYKEVENKNKDVKKRKETNDLIPKLASPEFVLAVAQKSALLDAATPKNPSEKLITKDILRTGNYWNAVWKEDVNPLALRSKRPKKLESIRAEIPPGSKLYDLVSKIKDISPTLLYVVNDKKT